MYICVYVKNTWFVISVCAICFMLLLFSCLCVVLVFKFVYYCLSVSILFSALLLSMVRSLCIETYTYENKLHNTTKQ